MSDTLQTGAERHIEHLMHDLDPSSERYGILATARRFKSSWAELGEKLLEVNSRGLFREWGYGSFEDYCQQEIRIRKQTAQKLTLAYRYLERHEPQLMERREELKPLPDYRSIDLLRQAREEKGFSDSEYTDLRKSVLEDERSHPTVRQQFKDVVIARGYDPPDPLVPLKAALSAARRLDTALCAMDNVPEGSREQIGALIVHIEAELEERKVSVETGGVRS